MKGLVLELAGLIAFILGLMGAFKFSSLLGSYLGTYVDWSPKTIQAVSFILTFFNDHYLCGIPFGKNDHQNLKAYCSWVSQQNCWRPFWFAKVGGHSQCFDIGD